jgi:hypothetical protein
MTSKATAKPDKFYDATTHQWIEVPPAPPATPVEAPVLPLPATEE